MTKKTSPTSIRLTDEQLQLLQEIAHRRGRSVSDVIRHIVDDALLLTAEASLDPAEALVTRYELDRASLVDTISHPLYDTLSEEQVQRVFAKSKQGLSLTMKRD